MSENSYSLTLSGGGNSLVITDENSQHALTVGEGSALSLTMAMQGPSGPAGPTDFAYITGDTITLNQTFSLTAGSTVQTYNKVGSIIFKSGNYSSENTYELPNTSGVFVVTPDGTIPTPESSEGGNWFDDAGKLLKFGSDGGVSVASVNVARTASKGSYLTDFGLEFWVDGLAYNEIRLQPPSVLTSDYYLTLPKSNATLATTTQADGSIGVGNVTGLQTALDGKQPLSSVLTATTASFTTAQETKLSGIPAASLAATANTLVLRNANGGGVSFAESAAGSTTVSVSNSGDPFPTGSTALSVTNFASDGLGINVFCSLGTAANIYSSGGIGAVISSDAGNHVVFGNDPISDGGRNRSFVARVKGAIGWFRGAFTGRIQAADTLTADRTYTLPNDTGTVALTNPSSGIQTFSGAQSFTGQVQLTGQAATDANSAMTRGLADARYGSSSLVSLRDDFVGAGAVNGTIGQLGWFLYSAGGGTGAAINNPSSSFPNIGARGLICGNSINAAYTLYQTGISSILTSTNWEACFVVALDQTSLCDLIVGFTTDNGAIGIGKFGGTSFGVRYSSASDTNYTFFSKKTNTDWAANDANNSSLASSVAANTAFHTFRMRSTTIGSVEMSVDNGSWVSVTMVSTSGTFLPFFYISTREAVSKSIKVDFYSFTQTGASR